MEENATDVRFSTNEKDQKSKQMLCRKP